MMLQKSLAHIALWLLFQLSVEINCQMAKPKQRRWHTATLIDNKLYILGGSYQLPDGTELPMNEFFYLDVSGPLNTKDLTWNDLSTNTIPKHGSAAAVVGGAKNS